MAEIQTAALKDQAVWSTAVSSNDVAESEKVDSLRQWFGQIWGSVDLPRDDTSKCSASIESIPFAPLRLSRVSVSKVRFRRNFSADRVGSSYSLTFPFKGKMLVRRDGRDFVLGPGSAFFIHNGGPCDDVLVSDDYETLNVRVPIDLFPHLSSELSFLYEWTLQHSGMAVLVRHFVRGLLEQAPTASPQMARFLSSQLGDLVTFLLTDSHAALASDSSVLRAHRMRARHYIESAFHDHDLSPARVAGACGISLSYLHKVFAAGDLSIMDEIRRVRLARARTMLAAPRFRSCSVSEIGSRCGFRSPQDFSRAFRQGYGESPTQYRAAAGS